MRGRFTTLLLALLVSVAGCRTQRSSHQTDRAAQAARELHPGFYILPYLQQPTPEGVTVLWWTHDNRSQGRVEYGEGFARIAAATSERVAAVGKTLHTATISGLEPGTRYSYRVRHGESLSPEYSFGTTVRRDQAFRFVVLGDGRTDDDDVIQRHRGITKLALSREPHFAIHNGDMVQTGEQSHWGRFWRRVVTETDTDDPGVPFASQIPYYLAIGNHEIYEPAITHALGYRRGNLETSMARYRAYVHVPENGSSNPHWEERYYVFRYGAATFIVLDTNNTSDDELDNHDYLPDGATPDWQPGSEQYRWLVQQLDEAGRSSVFTFVVMHPSPYSRGGHGDPDENQSGWHLRRLDELFRERGVDAVLASHDHLVERCLTGPPGFENQMDPTSPENLNYLVNGNAGQSTRRPSDGWETWMDVTGNDGAPFYTTYFYDWAGTEHTSFYQIDIEPLGDGRWRARFQLVRDDERVFDSFEIERRDPMSPPS